MSKTLVVALYGQVGTGKSTVSQYFQYQGWDYINQDVLGHTVLEEYPQELVRLFGEEILNDGSVDRKKISKLVFQDKDLLQQLVDFSYPIIIKKTNMLIQPGRFTIIEGAFFYKIRHLIPYNHLIYIFSAPIILYRRLLRRAYSKPLIRNILASQEDILLNANLADFVLNNSSDLDMLYQQIDLILSQF
ncbi:MAG: dephospho-CoA kinase [Brevinema sp.]